MNAKIKEKGKLASVLIRIFIVIISVAVTITVCALAAGAIFLNRSISKAMEADMLVAVDIADQYVTKEIELLKNKAAEAARSIDFLYTSGQNIESQKDSVLNNLLIRYPCYICFAVFDNTKLLYSSGKVSVPPDLIRKEFMQTAINGEGVVSTTMYSLDGMLVMYVSMPINDNLVLACVLPGFHLNNLISQFNFWQTGHLYAWDSEATVISNIRPHWVQQRNNFFEMAEKDSSFNAVASVVARGIAGERGIGHYSIDDVPMICAFRPISSLKEKWFIGIVAPRKESALKDIPQSIFLMGMITLILSAIAAAIAANMLQRPYNAVDKLRRDAEAISVSKSTFLANMSHEIRTPMNSIIGFSELALAEELSIKTRDYLDKIKTNAQWLLQIINDILDISKIEAGKMELENIPFDIHELFTSCRTLIMPKAVEKGIQLYFYTEPSAGKRPLGDPTRLRQVIVNLLSNAVKFTNKGIVKLQAEIQNIGEKTITIYFEVKDSGIGMTLDQIQKIFNPFTQAETGTTRKYGGTGLGLSITKTIIELMGGNISIESTPGVGSKFSFVLTFDTIDITGDEILDQKIILDELKKPLFEGEILLCEDNQMNQQVITEHLLRVGIKTIIADNGKTGLDMVKHRKQTGEKQFDLIFMDMHMPVMDGLEASTKIMELNTNIPIVAMTANIMTSDMEIYKKNGIYDCMGKPFTSQELWRCLMKYFTPITLNNEKINAQIEAELEFQKSLPALFVKSNQKKYEEIVKALEDNDIKLAHRLVHTLKSNAAQMGKVFLQRASENVEKHLKDGQNSVSEEELKILEAEFNMVLNEFIHLLGAKPAEASHQEGNIQSNENRSPAGEQTAAMFEKLESLLNRGNPECISLKNDLLMIPGNDELKNKLIEQMDNFDFLTALSTLKELKERIGLL